MQSEIDALEKNDTWVSIPRSEDDNIINTKWVFKVNQWEDGTMERYKAWLVANGMRQIKDTNYTQTFSPVVKGNSIRIVLLVALFRNWKINISNAFLHSKLEERIVVSQAPGFVYESHPDHVCLLQRSLYGSNSLPKCGTNNCGNFFIKLGFTESYSDTSLFILLLNEKTVSICICRRYHGYRF